MNADWYCQSWQGYTTSRDTLPVDGCTNMGCVLSAHTRITAERCSKSVLANEQITWGRTSRLTLACGLCSINGGKDVTSWAYLLQWIKQPAGKYLQRHKDTEQIYSDRKNFDNLYTIQDRRHQKHSPRKVREQERERKYEVLTNSMVLGTADRPTLPSRLGGGGWKKTRGI